MCIRDRLEGGPIWKTYPGLHLSSAGSSLCPCRVLVAPPVTPFDSSLPPARSSSSWSPTRSPTLLP
eukprot:9013440-Alexandrium_andersonii.AAC.1